ncbi:hypothetical protein Droror1_Dr00016387, partial [Drosera rotundifolia]
MKDEWLVTVAPYISISLSDVYQSLERWCLEGSRAKCKAAIYAISGFPGPCTHFALMELCQVWLSRTCPDPFEPV